MLKVLVAMIATSFGMTVGYFAAPRVLYSGLQPKVPFGSGIKVLPDPTNVWSWHHTFHASGRQEVVVDFDRDGRMDSHNACFRVLVTDMQVAFTNGAVNDRRMSVTLEDESGVRWDLLGGRLLLSDRIPLDTRTHLATPIAVPVGSQLWVRLEKPDGQPPLMVTLLGRIVNL